eukprot:TRINITY_DN14659_c0_g1_i1.p1 TRINITY_DN14659_c0_g1~~TRINITY_DN14659_c0_g1_i1.p1  ORF type:complete len:314 (+),score=48.52 TRINITY_DN14659_c0_g1_i1:63-944(+)
MEPLSTWANDDSSQFVASLCRYIGSIEESLKKSEQLLHLHAPHASLADLKDERQMLMNEVRHCVKVYTLRQGLYHVAHDLPLFAGAQPVIRQILNTDEAVSAPIAMKEPTLVVVEEPAPTSPPAASPAPPSSDLATKFEAFLAKNHIPSPHSPSKTAKTPFTASPIATSATSAAAFSPAADKQSPLTILASVMGGAAPDPRQSFTSELNCSLSLDDELLATPMIPAITVRTITPLRTPTTNVASPFVGRSASPQVENVDTLPNHAGLRASIKLAIGKGTRRPLQPVRTNTTVS